MSIWDVPLDKLRDSRLLALRMHVARYVVRTGATQRSVVAVLDRAALAAHGGTLVELLEAAGARVPRVIAAGDAPPAALPTSDVVLLGEMGRTAGEVAARWRGRGATSAGESQLWAIDVDLLAGNVDERIVDSVEALIRIVIPEALGANGTPPSPLVALPIG